MRILSDCNTVFITHMLKGARINTKVTEVMTNLSTFVRCQTQASDSVSSLESQDSSASDSDSSKLSSSTRLESESSMIESAASTSEATSQIREPASGTAESAASMAESAQQAQQKDTWAMPTQDATRGFPPASHKLVVQPRHDYTQSSHGCPKCPANLCKVSMQLCTDECVKGLSLLYSINPKYEAQTL